MKTYLQKTISPAPLAMFRAAFGLLLFAGVVRFWLKGWIDTLYIQPKYFFPFYGFEFIKPLGEHTYLLFFICAISALMVAFGYFYRIASILLFLSFTYIELIDKSTYLNHYYFISMVALLMIFLPANAAFSVDAFRKKATASEIPKWSLDSIKLLVCMLYFFAGLAKVNSDWLLNAQPLRMWLPAHNDLPVIGQFLNDAWVAYAFSWAGCLYDLSIPFLLLYSRTRGFAYVAVVVFHLLTALLFPIGMFPYIMIVTAVIFFSPDFHQGIVDRVNLLLGVQKRMRPATTYRYNPIVSRIIIAGFVLFFVVQAIMPFRHLAYPGELFWTEQGYRFSWRVMLMEKAGLATFIIRDENGRRAVVDNSEFLTTLQEKMVATQPDMILQYAHILRDHYASKGFKNPKVYVDSYVTLNGRMGRPLIDPSVDLAKIEDSFSDKTWIVRYEDDIKGL